MAVNASASRVWTDVTGATLLKRDFNLTADGFWFYAGAWHASWEDPITTLSNSSAIYPSWIRETVTLRGTEFSGVGAAEVPIPVQLVDLQPVSGAIRATLSGSTYSGTLDVLTKAGGSSPVEASATFVWTDVNHAVLFQQSIPLRKTPIAFTADATQFNGSMAPRGSEITITAAVRLDSGRSLPTPPAKVELAPAAIAFVPNRVAISAGYAEEGYYLDATLTDSSGETVVAPGTLSIQWIDRNGLILNQETRSFTTSDFTKKYSFSDPALHFPFAWSSFEKSFTSVYADLRVDATFNWRGAAQTLATTKTYVRSEIAATLKDWLKLEVPETGMGHTYSYTPEFVATVRLANIGKAQKSVNQYYLKAHTTVGRTYSFDGSATGDSIPDDLDPGASTTFHAFFPIPSGETVDWIEYSPYGDSIKAPAPPIS